MTPANEAGFTLHELLIASFIFIVGMSAVIVMQATLIKSNAVAGDISIASNIASSALEQLRISEFSRVRNIGNCPPVDPTFDIDCYYDRRGQALGTDASRRYFVLFWTATPDNKSQTTDVTVTVGWELEGFVVADVRAALDASRQVTMTGKVYPR